MDTGRNPHLCRVLMLCLKSNLDYRETDVIMWRYGLKKLTLEFIGRKALNKRITKEGIRKIEEKSLTKMRVFLKRKGIDKQYFE